MQNNAYDEIVDLVDRVRHWSLADQRKVLDVLETMARQQESTKPLYDLREFRGIGHGTWTDAGSKSCGRSSSVTSFS